MSTWTSRIRAALALGAALVVLAGCFETQALTSALTRASAPGPGSVGVLDGAITVAGPEGFCVDQGATRETGDQAFVLLVSCQGGRGMPVLSVTVSDTRVPPGDPEAQLAALLGFLLTDAGRGQLSRRGTASDVTIRNHRIDGNALWLDLADSGNPEGFAPGYWRVVMPLAGRLVTLSAMVADRAPVPGRVAPEALSDLIAVLRRRNLD
jgi:hypothetical protein